MQIHLAERYATNFIFMYVHNLPKLLFLNLTLEVAGKTCKTK
jgi:hypothetical protein